jgi:hypothetical protein
MDNNFIEQIIKNSIKYKNIQTLKVYVQSILDMNIESCNIILKRYSPEIQELLEDDTDINIQNNNWYGNVDYEYKFDIDDDSNYKLVFLSKEGYDIIFDCSDKSLTNENFIRILEKLLKCQEQINLKEIKCGDNNLLIDNDLIDFCFKLQNKYNSAIINFKNKYYKSFGCINKCVKDLKPILSYSIIL